jgi:3-deoxy-D-manno-octulosonic-acid transferase
VAGARAILPRTLECLYRVGVNATVWCVLAPYDLIRSVGCREPFSDLRERLALVSILPSRRRRLLVHAVSAGEVVAAASFLDSMLRCAPNCSVILTTGTRAGRRMAERVQERYRQVEHVVFLPWDRRRAMRRFLAGINPSAVITVEAELWPNLFAAALRQRCPVFVISGRLNGEEGARYRLARPFFREVLGSVRWIGAESQAAREAFLAAGAPAATTVVVGSLKSSPRCPLVDVPEPWSSELMRPGPTIVCGSTHQPEEQWLIVVFARLLNEFPSVRLVLAPRATERARRVAAQARAANLSTAFFSDKVVRPGWKVLLVDEIGPLHALYRHATVAIVGGSFVGRGGHNVIEPASLGRPSVVGPHADRIRDHVTALEEAGGIVRLAASVDPVEQLCQTLRALLLDPARCEAIGRNAASCCAELDDVADRYAEVVARTLDEDGWVSARSGDS